MTFLYLLINIASLSIPFAYSFEKKMNFKKNWNAVFLGIFIVAIPFLIWDVWFTKIGVWGFNPDYHLSINIFGLPLEEILFFICIPYASLFIHYSLYYFFPKLKLSLTLVKVITLILIFSALIIAFFNINKWYTVINFTVFALLLIYSYFKKIEY
ncbi:MAG TPA: lycopene cyclase domain-containing protein, partial [Flavobacteriaceae bacterium]|nr:lycopene cyclase domain-containing protein [Flavobacteriaceae bacterium]